MCLSPPSPAHHGRPACRCRPVLSHHRRRVVVRRAAMRLRPAFPPCRLYLSPHVEERAAESTPAADVVDDCCWSGSRRRQFLFELPGGHLLDMSLRMGHPLLPPHPLPRRQPPRGIASLLCRHVLRELTGYIVSPSTMPLCPLHRGGRGRLRVGLELLVILLQSAEDRGRFFGPVVQEALDYRDEILVMPLHLGRPYPRTDLRLLGEGIGPVAVKFGIQFLEACQGFP